MARTSSGGTDARIKELLDEVAALSEELLVERKRSLELLRELNREKDVNKRPLMPRCLPWSVVLGSATTGALSKKFAFVFKDEDLCQKV